MTLKLIFAASLLDVQHERDSAKNKPASLLVVPWKRHLAGFPHLGEVDKRRVAGNSYASSYGALIVFS